MGDIQHYGDVTYCTKDNLIEYYTTQEEDEVIKLKKDGETVKANSLVIEAVDTSLYVAMQDSNNCYYLKAGDKLYYDNRSITEFQVMGAAGKQLRWYAQTY